MAHQRTTHRRTLAAPGPPPHPKPNSSPDPTLQLQLQLQPQRPKPKPKQPPSSSTIIKTQQQVSDSSIPNSKKPFFMTNHFSRLNLNPKSTHLQGKAMTVSADFSLNTTPKQSFKDKARKKPITSNSNPKDLDKKKQQQQQQQHHPHHPHQHRHVDDDLKKKAALLSASLGIGRGGGGRGRRYSFSGSQLEVGLGDIVANCGVKIISVDMPPFMQIHAVDCARKTHDSLESFTSKTLALTLKKEFDGVYGPAWHCIVGTSFGSFVTHSVGGFLYFSMDQKLHVLLFKTTVQRAD